MIADGQTAKQTVINTGKNFAFDNLAFEEAGVHYFVVKEQAGTAEYVTYDETEYHVTITVTNTEGILSYTVRILNGTEEAEEITFTNTFDEPRPDPILVVLPVEKHMENRGGTHTGVDGYRFELLDASGKLLSTVISNEKGKARFELGWFDDTDVGRTYTYYIREVNTGLADVIYSAKVYKVEVEVRQADNTLYELVWKDGEVMDGDDVFVFTNVTVGTTPVEPKPPVSPDTGDQSMTPWIVVLAVSLLGMLTTAYFFFHRKRTA